MTLEEEEEVFDVMAQFADPFCLLSRKMRGREESGGGRGRRRRGKKE